MVNVGKYTRSYGSATGIGGMKCIPQRTASSSYKSGFHVLPKVSQQLQETASATKVSGVASRTRNWWRACDGEGRRHPRESCEVCATRKDTRTLENPQNHPSLPPEKGGLPSQNESKSSPKNLYFLTSFGCRFLDPVHAKFNAWLTVVNGFFGVFCTNPM